VTALTLFEVVLYGDPDLFLWGCTTKKELAGNDIMLYENVHRSVVIAPDEQDDGRWQEPINCVARVENNPTWR